MRQLGGGAGKWRAHRRKWERDDTTQAQHALDRMCSDHVILRSHREVGCDVNFMRRHHRGLLKQVADGANTVG